MAGAHGLCSGRAFIKLSGKLPPSGGGDAGSHRREELPPSGGGDKRGQDTKYGFLSPLDTPNLPFGADTSKMCSETGLRELGSVRRFAYGTLLCPEFPLRDPPRITVRGHPVQGGRFPLRTAPLLSMVYSWSTKRPCGPLAFRRATEGSRVLRKGWGVKRGRETLVSLPLLPPPPGGGNAHAMSWRTPLVPGGPASPAAAGRRNGGRSISYFR